MCEGVGMGMGGITCCQESGRTWCDDTDSLWSGADLRWPQSGREVVSDLPPGLLKKH